MLRTPTHDLYVERERLLIEFKFTETKVLDTYKQLRYLVFLRAIPHLFATTAELVSFPGTTPIT